ncbi:MAG: S41 family peptidase [Gammaproteobacteria bacterium]|jgi:hypothetical protein
MTRFRSPALLASLVLLVSAGTPAVAAEVVEQPAEDRFSPEAVQADFRYLYETLRAAHVDLYVYRSREAYERYYQELMGSIDGPMSRLEVARLFIPFLAFGQVGHAKIDFPVPDYFNYATSGGTLLPLDIRVIEGRVFITHNYSTDPALAPGSELLAINGRTAPDWLDHVGRYVSAERPYMVHAQLEAMFPRLVWLAEGQVETFDVVVRSPRGAEIAVTVDAVPLIPVEEQKGDRERAQHSRKAELLGDGVAYLRPGPFYAAGEGETLETFEAFIDEAFAQFIAADAADLIIDLRNNPGGDNSFSDPMIAWFADEPFRFASRFVVKASAATREVLAGLAEQYPGGISEQMLAAMQRHEDGETFDFEIPEVAPRDAGFSGRVWALVNRHSYSNATTVAAIIQDYGFGTLLGEETADLPTSYASSARFSLPETGIAVTYPKAYFVRPNGDEALRGVVPDESLAFPLVTSGADPVLEEALRLVQSRRL